MCYPRKYPLKDFMNIATRTRRLIATSLLFVGLAASLSHAQTPSITIVNGVTCTSGHAVSVTYAAGALNINTGGCGTVAILPPSNPPPVITLVSPASGQVGTIVTITGTGLTGAEVTFGVVVATNTVSSSTLITTTVPATAPLGPGSVRVTKNGVTVSSAFTVTATVAGDVSSDGIPLPNPSKLAFTIPPARNGLKGAGAEINAYAMNPARCNTIPALTRSWQHNITLDDYKNKNAFDYFAMQSGESLSYKFTVSDVDASGGFLYLDAAASGGTVAPTFMSISTAPCDFDISKLRPATRNSCYQTSISSASISWANITGTLPVSYCRLVKGQTYYFNLRFQDGRLESDFGTPTQDSCPSGRLCGGMLQIL